jgi:hypothetical protein
MSYAQPERISAGYQTSPERLAQSERVSSPKERYGYGIPQGMQTQMAYRTAPRMSVPARIDKYVETVPIDDSMRGSRMSWEQVQPQPNTEEQFREDFDQKIPMSVS